MTHFPSDFNNVLILQSVKNTAHSLRDTVFNQINDCIQLHREGNFELRAPKKKKKKEISPDL